MLFHQRLSQRVLSLKASPTLALAAQAKSLKAKGKDVISLSVGEPDWDTFSLIKDEAIFWLKKDKSEATRYTPAPGFPDLREAISEKINQDLNTNYTASNVLVSGGAKFVLFSALQSLIDPGDEVIVPTPYWVSYPPMVELAQGKVVFAKTFSQDGFKLKISHLEKLITNRTKVLILNTPSNPTGVVYERKDLDNLAQFLKHHPQLFVLSDDIYRNLVFKDSVKSAPHLLQSEPELSKRLLVVDGVSKTYAMTGWRLGWAVGEERLIKAMSHYQSQSLSSASALSQKAALKALTSSAKDISRACRGLKERRDFIVSLLKKIPEIQFLEPQGTFYIWVDVSAYLNKRWKNESLLKSSRDFADLFLEKKYVAVVPGIEFGEEGYIRISFALSKNSLQEAFDRFQEFLLELKS